jgi:hypothetical protein
MQLLKAKDICTIGKWILKSGFIWLNITIIEVQDVSTHYIQAYTDGSKNEARVCSAIAVFADGNLKTTVIYRLNEQCTNNQAKQMAILKALEYIQQLNKKGKNSPSIHRQ